MLVQNSGRLGFLPLLFGRGCMDSSTSALDFTALDSSLFVKSLGYLGLASLVFDLLHLEPLLSLQSFN